MRSHPGNVLHQQIDVKRWPKQEFWQETPLYRFSQFFAIEQLASQWQEVRRLLTGLISDVECAIHYNEGSDALSGEAPEEARAGIERMDALIGAFNLKAKGSNHD